MKKNILVFALISLCIFVSAQQKPNPLTITPNTHFVQLPEEIYWVSDLEDGVWTVYGRSRKGGALFREAFNRAVGCDKKGDQL